MSRRHKVNQTTLRKIPDNLYKQLRNIARRNNTSINKTIINILKKSTGVENGEDKKRDLADLSGAWEKKEYDDFRTHTRIFDTIDEEVWK